MWVCVFGLRVCVVCVCEFVWLSFCERVSVSIYMCVCGCVGAWVCVCVCV